MNGGEFDMNLEGKEGFIYIKNNGAKHPIIFTRALGVFNFGKLNIVGRKLTRTWSLLSEKAFFGMGTIYLAHNPQDMV